MLMPKAGRTSFISFFDIDGVRVAARECRNVALSVLELQVNCIPRGKIAFFDTLLKTRAKSKSMTGMKEHDLGGSRELDPGTAFPWMVFPLYHNSMERQLGSSSTVQLFDRVSNRNHPSALFIN